MPLIAAVCMFVAARLDRGQRRLAAGCLRRAAAAPQAAEQAAEAQHAERVHVQGQAAAGRGAPITLTRARAWRPVSLAVCGVAVLP